MDNALPTKSSDVLETLRQASEGLLWMSESDYPFEPVFWGAESIPEPSPTALLAQTGHAADASVQTVELDTFFQWATQEQDWHSGADRAIARRYQTLLETLKQHLHDVTVYRIGEVAIDIYILGKTATGDVAGLATKAIET